MKFPLLSQIRASFCMVLVIAIRLLNLAVPFLYKKASGVVMDCLGRGMRFERRY